MSRNMIFLYRIKDSNDRDCCAYIENKPMRFECGHYFGSPILHGACYSKHDYEEYDNIETILTREEYEALIDFKDNIKNLGSGIDKDSDRYNEGVELCKQIEYVYDKLKSDEAKEFFEEIKESEKEYLMDEYNLSYEDVEHIYNEYIGDYYDRSIVCCIYSDAYDCGYETAWSCGYIESNNSIQERYFDFERFGQDLVDEDEYYLELEDGRIVYYAY